jgi:hypothetical protein
VQVDRVIEQFQQIMASGQHPYEADALTDRFRPKYGPLFFQSVRFSPLERRVGIKVLAASLTIPWTIVDSLANVSSNRE